jgi:hypothetical protein
MVHILGRLSRRGSLVVGAAALCVVLAASGPSARSQSSEGCGQLLMYRYFRNSVLIDLLPELFPPGFREREGSQA